MARILAVSSQVARGHVGLSAIVPALQGLGHEVIVLPTILLSNHPGHAHAAAERVDPSLLLRMLAALDGSGWLAEVDAVLTGYMPSAEHADVAADAIRLVRQRRPGARVVVDPILGDDAKGVYIEAAAAARIRDVLVPLADVATPNRFELEWLTHAKVGDASDAVRASAALSPLTVVATSVPAASGALDNVLAPKGGAAAYACAVARRPGVPHGTGDLLAALYLGHELTLGPGRAPEVLALAVAGVDSVIAASQGRDELAIVQARDAWRNPTPASARRL